MANKTIKRKKKKVNVVIAFSPENYEKLKLICEARYQKKVGYLRMLVMPVLEKDFIEVQKCSKK